MDSEAQRPLIGVYTPNLQGFFFGELISQLYQLAHLKDYRISVIRTGSNGDFQSRLHTEHFDYTIILRNAIHPSLAGYLVNMGKPVVSVGYDYFPLRIPVVGADNYQGTELAFQHLLRKGIKRIAFVGNISHFNFRKRYEAYCELHEKYDIEIDETNIYSITTDSSLGVMEAADTFIRRAEPNTGVICAQAFDGISFYQRLKNKSESLLSQTSIVSFGSNSLVPASNTKIAIIDLNLHLVAYKAINKLESLASDKEVNHHLLVECKLIDVDNPHYQEGDAYLATAIELPELSDPNYVKSIFCSIQEWPKIIAESDLDGIMMLDTLFGKFLDRAFVGRIAKVSSGKEFIKIDKVITSDSVVRFEDTDRSSLLEIDVFPPNKRTENQAPAYLSLIMPIIIGKKLWGVLSTEAYDYRSTNLSSFTALSAYLENTIDHYIKIRLERRMQSTKESQATTASSNKEFKIVWNKNRNETLWDDEALEYLGFTSELEKGIYKYMEISDRLDDESEIQLTNAIQANEFDIEIKIRHKNKSYIPFRLSAHTKNMESETRDFFLNPFT